MSKEPVRPPDEGVPWAADYVDELRSHGGPLCPEFIPNVLELRHLAEMWLRQVYDVDLGWFIYRQASTGRALLRDHALARLGRVADVLGTEEMGVIEARVEGEMEGSIGKKLWGLFTAEREWQWPAPRAEVEKELKRLKEARPGARRLSEPPGD